MNNIQLLEVKAKLNRLKSFATWENAFNDEQFTLEFAEFIHSKIGSKWLTGNKSSTFKKWQASK